MAAPVVDAVSTGVEDPASLTHTVTAPTGTGGVLEVTLCTDRRPSTNTFTFPTGLGTWTTRLDADQGSTGQIVKATKADNGETNIAITSSASCESSWQVRRISGCDLSVTPEYQTSVASGVSTVTPGTLSITGGPLDALIVCDTAIDGARTATSFPTTPATFINTSTAGTGGGGTSVGGAFCDLERTALSSITPGTFTISGSDDYVCAVGAYYPAAASTIAPLAAMHTAMMNN